MQEGMAGGREGGRKEGGRKREMGKEKEKYKKGNPGHEVTGRQISHAQSIDYILLVYIHFVLPVYIYIHIRSVFLDLRCTVHCMLFDWIGTTKR